MSIYFADKTYKKRKQYLTIAFNNEYKLYKKCKVLGSKKIKNMLKIETYDNLVRNATKDNRPLGNYIKSQLKKILR